MDEDARQAVVLYAVADRDMMDFLEMLRESNDRVVALLYAMVVPENQIGRAERGTDVELNALLESIVRGQLEKRGILGTWEALLGPS